MERSNVCLILEGTYPYVSGGVSSWAHDLILSQPDKTFSLVCLLAPDAKLEPKYPLPSNVVGVQHIVLQKLEDGDWIRYPERVKLFKELEVPLLTLQHHPKLITLKSILDALDSNGVQLGSNVLLNSEEAWQMLVRMYLATVAGASFLDYFWSWRGLLAGFYSTVLAPIPDADCYHALCTGYAGLYLACCKLRKNGRCILTEHGIYTNERRVEITAAKWLEDRKSMNLDVYRAKFDKDLKDFWIDTFSGYSQLAYHVCDEIITLFEGNTHFQLQDGANPDKIKIIPNGIPFKEYSALKRDQNHPPTVALIGRVVPIKDIKTLIRAALFIRQKIPDVKVYIIGSAEEDPDYAAECVELIEKFSLQKTVMMTGKVNVKEWLPKIDVIVLTSISEAQPLVLLEAGAAGIPCVATNVGACHEIVFGASNEDPPLGQAGVIVPLCNPQETANGVCTLLSDPLFYHAASKAIKKRVETYYNSVDQALRYKEIYSGRDRICLKEAAQAR